MSTSGVKNYSASTKKYLQNFPINIYVYLNDIYVATMFCQVPLADKENAPIS